METLIIAILAGLGFLVAYHTYGRWLSRRLFKLDPDALVPSVELNDDRDYVPTDRSIVFGHHFTSIAGTGPIVNDHSKPCRLEPGSNNACNDVSSAAGSDRHDEPDWTRTIVQRALCKGCRG